MLKAMFLALSLGAASVANASQEGVLALGTFQLESEGIGESGPVGISGRQSRNGVESLKVTAFGKVFNLTKEHLKDLQGGMLNAVQLTYEAGYKSFGGRTVYLRFTQGFTSGVVDTRLVTISEDGRVKVTRETK